MVTTPSPFRSISGAGRTFSFLGSSQVSTVQTAKSTPITIKMGPNSSLEATNFTSRGPSTRKPRNWLAVKVKLKREFACMSWLRWHQQWDCGAFGRVEELAHRRKDRG